MKKTLLEVLGRFEAKQKARNDKVKLKESFKEVFLQEGHTEEEAERLAQAAVPEESRTI